MDVYMYTQTSIVNKKKTFEEIKENQPTNLQHIYSGVTRGKWPLLCDMTFVMWNDLCYVINTLLYIF